MGGKNAEFASHGFATRAIHVGQPPDPINGAVNVPLYLTSTYAQKEIGGEPEYDYSRAGNPTRTAIEQCLASLEGGTTAHVFGSGMAAIAALVTMLKTGDHVICGSNVYGGTPRLFNQIFAHYGIAFTYVDTSNLEELKSAIRPETKLVHIETPTNPLMTLTDITAVAEICHGSNRHAGGIEMSVDNTFMSPYFQRPIELGADIVMHSTTKFINGHSDGIGGVLIGTKPEHREKFDFVEKAVGAILSPFESWLIMRGVKTLAVRMKQHDENGRAVADFVSEHKKVLRVFYPGLKSGPNAHPQYRACGAADVGLWLDDHARSGISGQCEGLHRAAGGRHTWRVAGRSGNPGVASGDDDSCRAWRRWPGEDWHHRWDGALVGWNRRCR